MRSAPPPHGRRLAGRAALLAAPIVLALTGLTAPAQADHAVCWWDSPTNGPGAGFVTGNFNLKRGEEAACPNVRKLTKGTQVYLRCYYYNQYGNRWWNVRVQGTNTLGWLSADSLATYMDEPGGSFKECAD